jgi:methylated-DNA-[protein]-cysteine S-methyltransferase
MNPFAKRVYKIVAGIPLGEVRTYKWVAAKAGRLGAARAVGQLMKRNPYPLLIPCHRVIKSNKQSGGYIFGIKIKKILLQLEKEIKSDIILVKPRKYSQLKSLRG